MVTRIRRVARGPSKSQRKTFCQARAVERFLRERRDAGQLVYELDLVG